MTRSGLLALLFGLATLPAPAVAGPNAPLVRVPVPKPRDERIVSLGPAQVRELAGEATMRDAQVAGAPSPLRPLTMGMTLSAGAWLRTSSQPASRAELRFADGSLLRLGPDTEVSIVAAQRQILLHRGRVLVVADRMVGGIAVLTATRAFLPEGTTYLVETLPAAGSAPGMKNPGLALSVLEGAVCACAVETSSPSSAPGKRLLRPQPRPTREQIVLPGEAWTTQPSLTPSLPSRNRPPMAIDLATTLRSDPLLVAFSSPLPTLAKINELAEQQRRKILSGRNARLRREIYWQRPPRTPLRLPAFFAEPNSVTVTYE